MGTAMNDPLVVKIVKLARMAERRPEVALKVLSSSELCAVAFLCNNAAFLPKGYTFLDAEASLKGEWLAACLLAKKQGWRE